MDIQELKTIPYWQQVLPEFSISDSESVLLTSQKPLSNVQLSSETFIAEGYQQFDGVIDPGMLAVLQTGVSRLQDQGWLPVFAMLFDPYWAFVASLKNLITESLGKDAQMLPDFWAWYVDPKQEQSGWNPHRDKPGNTLLENGMPHSATVWVALTDATPLNGCMYLLPADRDPGYHDYSNNVPEIDLQSVRALTAPAGSVLIWNQRIFHWGSKSSHRAKQPRLSIAFEFQRGDIPAFNQPLMPLQIFPEFGLRLKLVGKQILQYKHMYSYSDELVAIAEAFLE
jgi:hypothetical protein